MSPRAQQLAAELEEANQETLARWCLHRAETSRDTTTIDVPVQLCLETEA
jgi:hypothetical protein